VRHRRGDVRKTRISAAAYTSEAAVITRDEDPQLVVETFDRIRS
jgi:hypothetical protein